MKCRILCLVNPDLTFLCAPAVVRQKALLCFVSLIIDSLLVHWKLTVFYFFSARFVCSKICRFVQSARLFSSRFTHSTNMSYQISQIRVTSKNFATKVNFFLQRSSLFLGASVSRLISKQSNVDTLNHRTKKKPCS